MSDLLSIASSGVSTYQRALGVVSNNIANAATEGYSRQDVSMESSPTRSNGRVYLGTGVMVQGIRRQYDAFVESNLRNSQSDLQSQQPMVDYTNRVVDVMGGETSGLAGALDKFFATARALSTDPASTVLRSSFLRDADGLAGRFNQLSAQLDLVDSETQEAVKADIKQMNALAGQLASVNQQLAKNRELTRQPPELLDQRDQLLLALSKFVKINAGFEDNGMVNVSLGASITQDVLVHGKDATLLDVTFDTAAPERFSLVLDPYGQPRPISSIQSGQLAGLIAFREQVLTSTRTAMDDLARTLAREVNAIHTQGVDANGQRGTALFGFAPEQAHASAGLQVLLQDPLKVCAASSFRIIEDPSNPGTADATIRFDATPYPGPAALDAVLANNGSVAAARSIVVGETPGTTGLTTIPAGLQDVTLYLDTLSPGQQLQVLTRDGRHLAGQALSTALQDRMLATGNGFESAATYSTEDINLSDGTGYKGLKVFYGARAAVQPIQQFDSNDKAIAPSLQPAVLQGGNITTGWSGLPGGGAFTLNGLALGPLTPASGSSIQASDVATWLNAASAPGVYASAANEIRLSPNQLRLNADLRLNGVAIDFPVGGYASVEDLAEAINAQSADSRVQAQLGRQGELILNNTAGFEGEDIVVVGVSASTPNALGLAGGTYGGQVRLQRATGDTGPIELGIGTQGDPATLAKLGLRTQMHIEGAAPDDLLVFVTGAGTAKIAASYSGEVANPTDRLRQSPLVRQVPSATRFPLPDQTPGTLVAERDYDPNAADPTIRYQGLNILLSKPPLAGDRFVIDGNNDGTGDNQAMLDILALEKRPVVGSKTLAMAYIDHVNDVGNTAKQASIVQSSLKVVHDQAVASRDQVSGVSLDEEATNLIRYQQAYQASAKALQIASQLFDTMLQIR
ncbi:MAG: flagellar hook-associated protein FlgK [Limnohabitans sp.]